MCGVWCVVCLYVCKGDCVFMVSRITVAVCVILCNVIVCVSRWRKCTGVHSGGSSKW
jgi:hypothetical protein